MKLACFSAKTQHHWGCITDEGAIPATALYERYPSLMDFIKSGADWSEINTLKSEPLQKFTFEKPIDENTRIMCVGVNFPDRNAEYKDGSDAPQYMSLFPRFASSFTAHQKPLIRPPESHLLDYEGEMAVIIGKEGRRISQENALNHIAALTICNEGTLRDWVRHAKFNVTQGKNWDKSGSLGPWIVPFNEPSQIENAEITTRVNGEIRQNDNTSRMLFPVKEQIAYISTFMTLHKGDVIITGTPTGAGARLDPPCYLTPNDLIEVEISGIGTLINSVKDE